MILLQGHKPQVPENPEHSGHICLRPLALATAMASLVTCRVSNFLVLEGTASGHIYIYIYIHMNATLGGDAEITVP